MRSNVKKRRICFVSGTRAEFGLMRSTLQAIKAHPTLRLQIVATGMHLDDRHGRTIDQIKAEGWTVDAIAKWDPSEDSIAKSTGVAIAELAAIYQRLKSDVILVVGDRVEAFAAATAGHLSQQIVAHVHGGDRALGQVDDSLRHAITKLSHVHFPATKQSEERIIRLGEDRSRVFRVGSPGMDGISQQAMAWPELRNRFDGLKRNAFALVVFHPVGRDEAKERANAETILSAIRKAGVDQCVVVYPNNDPGSKGIIRAWQKRQNEIKYLLPDVPREQFLGLMRDAAFLIGNSSSGIIEASSFGTPVIDIGDRQRGRERSENCLHVDQNRLAIEKAVAKVWQGGSSLRFAKKNVYGRDGASKRISEVLAGNEISTISRTKLISY